MATLSANPLLPVLWLAVLYLAAVTLGQPLARWTRGDRRDARPAAHANLHIVLLGFVALGWIAFALAALHLLYPAWVRLLLSALALPAAIRAGRASWAGRRQLFGWRPAWAHVPLALAVLFFLQFLPRALSPLLVQDDLVYHLFLPKTYLEMHGFVNLPWHVNANMPHAAEVLYALPMACGDFTAPKLLTLSFVALTLAGLWSFAVPRCGRFGAGLLLLVYLSGKNVQWHLGIGHVEPIMGAYLLGGVLALAAWRADGSRGPLWRLGIYAGFAAATKYTGWIFAAVLCAALVAALVRARRPWRAGLGDAGIVVAMLSVSVLPWLVKSAIYTGNPFFPNLYGLFGGHAWSAVQETHYRLAMRTVERAGPYWTWKDFLAMPWRLPLADHYYSCPSFSIVLMLLLGLALWRPGPAGRALLWVALAGAVAWAISAPQGRYLVAWVPVLCLAVAGVLSPIERRGWAWRVAALALVLAAGGYQFFAQREAYVPRWGDLARRRVVVQQNPGYDLCQYLDGIVPASGRVLGMWENRFFFLHRCCVADAIWQVPAVLAELRQTGDAARFATALARAGITHVVVRRAGFDSYFANHYAYDLTDAVRYPRARYDADRQLVVQFIGQELLPVRELGGYSIFQLRDSATPRSAAPPTAAPTTRPAR